MDWFLYDKKLRHERVNKASGLHPTTLTKIELFDGYFPRILSRGAEQLFVEHLRVAACKNLKKRRNTTNSFEKDCRLECLQLY